jgi:hypothetical protein
MRRYREAYADALAAVEQFNARLSAKKSAWFWPTIAAALTSKQRLGKKSDQVRTHTSRNRSVLVSLNATL